MLSLLICMSKKIKKKIFFWKNFFSSYLQNLKRTAYLEICYFILPRSNPHIYQINSTFLKIGHKLIFREATEIFNYRLKGKTKNVKKIHLNLKLNYNVN